MASNNNAFIRSLKDIYEAKLPGVSFDPKESRIQCFPHVINTCVQHTIKALNNGVDTDIDDEADDKGSDDESDDEESGGEKTDGENTDGEKSDSDGEKGDSDDDGGSGSNHSDSDEDVASKVPGDPLNKVRALVRGIRASGQRQEQFVNVILGGNQYGWWKDGEGNPMVIKQRQLLRDVRTRWDSTYQMLVRVRELRQVGHFSDITPSPFTFTDLST